MDAVAVRRMMTVSLTGFAFSSAFVTVEGFELPFYIALLCVWREIGVRGSCRGTRLLFRRIRPIAFVHASS